MIPGLITKMSEQALSLATTINPSADMVHVTSTSSTTVLATINSPFAGSPGIFTIVNRSGGNITTVTTGNIAAARTIPQNMPIVFTYSILTSTWYPGAIS